MHIASIFVFCFGFIHTFPELVNFILTFTVFLETIVENLFANTNKLVPESEQRLRKNIL